MATVPIPWFTGAPYGGVSPYMGKAIRQRRQLQALSQGMYDVGAFLRQRRSQGLPPGATDEDLRAEEEQLETQLQTSQASAKYDSQHGVERAHVAGDAPAGRDIANDPATYAAEKHEQSQGLLPRLGGFMKQGVGWLMGDQQRQERQERLSHINRMKGELAYEKDRENFLKTTASTCMKSEDPDACLREMDPRRRFGMTHLPKMVQRPVPGTPEAAGLPPNYVMPPNKSLGGSETGRSDWDQAERNLRNRGVLPADQDQARGAIEEEVTRMRNARDKAKKDDADRRRKEFLDYRLGAQAAMEAQRDFRRAQMQGGNTVTESWPEYRDSQGHYWNMDDTKADELNRKFPGLDLVKTHISVRHKEAPAAAPPPPNQSAAPSAAPQEEPDPGDPWGVKFYAPFRDERGGQ